MWSFYGNLTGQDWTVKLKVPSIESNWEVQTVLKVDGI